MTSSVEAMQKIGVTYSRRHTDIPRFDGRRIRVDKASDRAGGGGGGGGRGGYGGGGGGGYRGGGGYGGGQGGYGGGGGRGMSQLSKQSFCLD